MVLEPEPLHLTIQLSVGLHRGVTLVGITGPLHGVHCHDCCWTCWVCLPNSAHLLCHVLLAREYIVHFHGRSSVVFGRPRQKNVLATPNASCKIAADWANIQPS